MPHSLVLDETSSTAAKRPRSQESRDLQPNSAPPSQAGYQPSEEDKITRLARAGIKVPSYLNKSKTDITTSFQDLEWRQRSRVQQAFQNPDSPFKIDRSDLVLSRNRYFNVQPWQASRIRLKPPIEGSDYINASPIRLKSRNRSPRQNGDPMSDEIPGNPSITQQETNYIASQGPKSDQYLHFWQMVIQESIGEVGVIIMLTQCYEGNKEKCAQYFPLDMENPVIILQRPKEDSSKEQMKTGDDGDPFLEPRSISAVTDLNTDDASNTMPGIQNETQEDGDRDIATADQIGTVTLTSLQYDSSIGCEVREIDLQLNDKSKKVYHYLFDSWPDFGKPEAEDRAALIQLTRVTRDVAQDSPRIVHCSAGVGRTGTWIALDFLLRELDEGNLITDGFNDTNSQSNNNHPPTTTTTNTKEESSTSKSSTSPRLLSNSWGKSGPFRFRARTPETTNTTTTEETDPIYQTVDMLREQRMMMVMNELQYSFIYDVIKESFLIKYGEKQTGPIVRLNNIIDENVESKSINNNEEVKEPIPKIARKKYHDPSGLVVKDDGDENDGYDNENTISEAETEIIDQNAGEEQQQQQQQQDPYSKIAPAKIRQGTRKKDTD